MTTEEAALIEVRAQMSQRYLLRGSAIAAVMVATLVSCATGWAAANANLDEASRNEASAGEQLGLRPLEGDPLVPVQLIQTVAISPGGGELFGFDQHPRTKGGAGCPMPADNGYLGFRPPGGKLRLVSRLPALSTPPVIGGDREAVVASTLNCKQPSARPYNYPLEKLRLLTGAVGRRPTVTTVLSSTAEQDTTAIAASPSGDLAVAWLAPHQPPRPGAEPTDLLHISIGHTSGSAGRSVALGEQDGLPHARDDFFTQVRLAWTAHHELLVVYAVNHLVVAQRWRPDHGFSRPQKLGPVNEGWGVELTVAVGTRRQFSSACRDCRSQRTLLSHPRTGTRKR